MALHPDFVDLLTAFADAKVEYLVIGGYAVSFHAKPRFTNDIDIWIGPEAENLSRACEALARFGAPPATVEDLRSLGLHEILYMGRPPVRVDILRALGSADFRGAFARRVETSWEGVAVFVIGLDDLIALKQAAGRDQDKLDTTALLQVQEQKKL